MYYGNLKKYDIANGTGVRVSLFVSGCTNACEGCFQKETWDFHYGQKYSEKTEAEILEALNQPYIQGFTLLGGEPFELANQRVLVTLLKKIKKMYPQKDIWCYTGFVYDRDLVKSGKRYCEVTDEMLDLIDVLVDGPFILALKDLRLAYCGSRNQRVIDLKQTRLHHQIVLQNTDVLGN